MPLGLNNQGSKYFFDYNFSMQDLTATTRHGVTRKKCTKRLKHKAKLFRKSVQVKSVCYV